MGKGSRNQQDYHMALRPPQFRCKCAWCRSEHQDRCLSNGTFKYQDDREISPRHWPAEAGRNQQPRRPWLWLRGGQHVDFTPWHFWHFGTFGTLRPTSEGSSFFRRSSSMNFGLVQYGGIYRANPNQDNIWGQRKEKTMKNARIFCIIRILELENAGNADSMAVSVNIFSGIIPLHTLHSCTLWKCQSVKNATG